MFSLLKKELSAFFSSITGYIVIFVFLLVCGLVLWVFRGDMNIIDSGFAYMDPLFQIAPWVFLFLGKKRPAQSKCFILSHCLIFRLLWQNISPDWC